MIVLLLTQGEVNFQEMRYECKPGKWFPIFTYKIGNGPQTIPVFWSESTAKDFIKRNLPKKWLRGAVDVDESELQQFKDKGMIIEDMTFPKKIRDIPGIVFLEEILVFEEEPDFMVGKL